MAEEANISPHLLWEFVFSLDAQGRVAIPSEWRGGIRYFYVIPGKNATLQLYPESTFEERIMSKLKKLSPANEEDLQKLRWFGSRMMKGECDKQGRIQLPAILIEYAKLKKKVALIGSGDFAQIMPEERWMEDRKLRDANSDAFLNILG